MKTKEEKCVINARVGDISYHPFLLYIYKKNKQVHRIKIIMCNIGFLYMTYFFTVSANRQKKEGAFLRINLFP